MRVGNAVCVEIETCGVVKTAEEGGAGIADGDTANITCQLDAFNNRVSLAMTVALGAVLFNVAWFSDFIRNLNFLCLFEEIISFR